MPVYEYQCLDCGEMDQRVGGLDDQTAICALCGSLMLRLDEDVFQPYFARQDELQEVSDLTENGECLEETRTCGHADGEPVLFRPAAPGAAVADPTLSAAISHKYFSY